MTRRHLLLALVFVWALPAAHAQDAPKVHRQGASTYVSGGSSPEQRKELFLLAPKYPIQLIFQVDGEVEGVSGVKVKVRDISGNVLVEAVSEGPFFYCNPPAGGRFTIEAEYLGQTQSQTKDLIGRRYLVLEYKFASK
jgi:hypothetical protein